MLYYLLCSRIPKTLTFQKSINQVISYFLTNCFTFLTNFWMFQVRKSCFCGFSVIFFHCCFMSETLMTVSNFCFFSVNHFLERGFIFWWGLPHGGHWLWWGGFQKKSWDRRGHLPAPPTMANSETGMYFLFNFAWYSIQLDIFC